MIEFLKDSIKSDPNAAVSDLSQNLVSQVDDFSGFARQADDITFVLARARCKSPGTGTIEIN
jgi:hypothetical protein